MAHEDFMGFSKELKPPHDRLVGVKKDVDLLTSVSNFANQTDIPKGNSSAPADYRLP
jgi:hypothetical protein